MKFCLKLSLILLILLCFASPSFAWEQSFEGNPNDLPASAITGDCTPTTDGNGYAVYKYSAYNFDGILYITDSSVWDNKYLGATCKVGSTQTFVFGFPMYTSSGTLFHSNTPTIQTTLTAGYHRIEFIQNDLGNAISLWVDGINKGSYSLSGTPLNINKIGIFFSTGTGGWIQFDDLTSQDTIVACPATYSGTNPNFYYRVGYTPYAGVTWYTKVLSPTGRTYTTTLSNLSEQSIPKSFINESGQYLIKLYQNDDSDHGTPMESKFFSYGQAEYKLSTDKKDYYPGDTITISTYAKNPSGCNVEIPYYDKDGKLQTYKYSLTDTEQITHFTIPSTSRGGSFVIALLDSYGGVKVGTQYNCFASGGISEISIDKTVYAPLDVVKISYSNMPASTQIVIKVQNGNSVVTSQTWNAVQGSGVLTYTLPSSTSADNFIVYGLSGTTMLGQTTGTIISGIYYLSGNIVDPADGSLIPGATITVGTATTVSDTNGHYNFTVPAGWQALTVSKTGYMTNSNKVNIVYKVATQDFYLVKTYSGNGHSIYGLVADYYTGAPVSSALITLKQGSTTHTLFSYTGSGYYVYDAEDMTGNWTVTVTKSGYYTYTGTVTVSGDTYKQINLTPTKFSATGDTGSSDSSGGSSSDSSGSSGSSTNGGTSGNTDASTIDTTGVSQDRPGREAAKGAMDELETTVPALIGLLVFRVVMELVKF